VAEKVRDLVEREEIYDREMGVVQRDQSLEVDAKRLIVFLEDFDDERDGLSRADHESQEKDGRFTALDADVLAQDTFVPGMDNREHERAARVRDEAVIGVDHRIDQRKRPFIDCMTSMIMRCWVERSRRRVWTITARTRPFMTNETSACRRNCAEST
jgi:hypothetical protein